MIRTRPLGSRSAKLTLPSKAYQTYARWIHSYCPALPSDRPFNITSSHTHRFLWYRVAKVCTRSIFSAFHDGGIALDAAEPNRCYYPPKYYQAYFKFAFVRNPWDRLVSCWCNKVLETNYFGLIPEEREMLSDFSSFVDWVAKLDVETCDKHLRLQCRLIDLNHVDFIGRFENFERDFRAISDRIGMRLVKIPRVNASTSSFMTAYDDDTKVRVAEIYRRDIMTFGYEFDQGARHS